MALLGHPMENGLPLSLIEKDSQDIYRMDVDGSNLIRLTAQGQQREALPGL